MKTVIHVDSVGRLRQSFTFTRDGDLSDDETRDAVVSECIKRKVLMSRCVEAVLDEDGEGALPSGRIFAGVRYVGSFRVTAEVGQQQKIEEVSQ